MRKRNYLLQIIVSCKKKKKKIVEMESAGSEKLEMVNFVTNV